MSIFSVLLGFQIAFGLLEVIIFQIGAVILGFAIHFFVTSRKSMNLMQKSAVSEEPGMTEADEWRLRYYEQIDLQKKVEEETITELEAKVVNEKRLSRILNEVKLELASKEEQEDLLKQKVEDLEKELDILRETPSKPNQADLQAGEYLEQLASAQLNLSDHNQRINRLLEQINMLQESERRHLEIKQTNETLQMQVRDLRQALAAKESEINRLRQEQLLIHELKERLEKAHEEYNGVQEKLDKLEIQISKPHNRTFEYEELQQSYFRLTKECDEIRIKQLSLLEENQRLSRILADTEDKLRESNFQRQQYLRKVTFLEELNHDLQEMSGQQKKLESQMRRISEIETLLKKSSENL
jgi:hypothetical protein